MPFTVAKITAAGSDSRVETSGLKCLVCGEPASGEEIDAWNLWRVRCVHCGEYAIGKECVTGGQIKLAAKGDAFKLCCVMAERKLKGLGRLLIKGEPGAAVLEPPQTVTTLNELLAGFPRAPTEFFDRALLNLSRSVVYPSDLIPRTALTARILFSPEKGLMLMQLVGLEYLVSVSHPAADYYISAHGWERIEKLNAPGKDSHQAFVAMWFDPIRNEVFEKGIRLAIEADGATKAIRIDQKEHNEHIDDEIVAEIRRSRYLVADATEGRNGVYWEAGFALGLGLPVIWCIEATTQGGGDTMPDVHFDTRQYKHIVYTGPEDLRVKLLNRIRATIV